MLPDRVSNPGPLTYESGALLIALHGPAGRFVNSPYDLWFDSVYDVRFLSNMYDVKCKMFCLSPECMMYNLSPVNIRYLTTM